eukprot:TRINITY_DN2882_c0_g1_i1.p1 TRINITY_DN2882_c0_g1~~TRINITY_DN2882_c0_g1_i1.p1  ORF type:complete len:175 (+),score=40.34 TRINITY_DN2882_c0_g1_i1:10-534(+)
MSSRELFLETLLLSRFFLLTWTTHKAYVDFRVVQRDIEDEGVLDQPLEATLQCPISHATFTDPVVADCIHVFDRSSIIQLINQAAGNRRVIACPISGCNEEIRQGTLKPDVFTRKLLRRQQYREEAEMDSIVVEGDGDEDGEGNEGEEEGKREDSMMEQDRDEDEDEDDVMVLE